MTKIAIFLPFIDGGGVERTMLRVARGLRRGGVEIDLLYCVIDEQSLADELDSCTNLVRLQSLGFPRLPRLLSRRASRSLFAIPALACYLRRTDVEALLVAQSTVVGGAAHWIARSRSNLVFRQAIHQSAANQSENQLVSKFMAPMKRLVYKRASAVIANSSESAADLVNTTGLDESKIRVIFNPAADDRLRELAKEDPPASVSPDDGTPTVVSVGRLAAQKDFPTLIKAMAIVDSRRPCRLVIVGDGPQRASLLALAESLGIRDKVILAGYLHNPWSVVSRSRLFVLSSAWEGQPSALIEAMALGVPVVSTDCLSGPREILEDGKLGPLVPVGDHQAMADAIMRLLDDKNLAGRNAAASLESMHRFRLPAIVHKYADALGIPYQG